MSSIFYFGKYDVIGVTNIAGLVIKSRYNETVYLNFFFNRLSSILNTAVDNENFTLSKFIKYIAKK